MVAISEQNRGNGEEILVNVTPQETRVAVVENGVLQEVFVERSGKRGLVGNIYRGKVNRVLPGMEAAFVDVGLDRAAFLHVSDIDGAYERDENGETHQRTISEMVREGQKITAQIVKDPLGSKGARITTQLSIPSRFLVFLPDSDAVGVSVKIEDEAERQRLKDLVSGFRTESGGGYIVRTAVEGAQTWALRADMQYLQRLWDSTKGKINTAEPGELIYEDLPLAVRILRDYVGGTLDRMRIDSRETYEYVRTFAEQFVPELAQGIEHYPGERPILDLYGVEDEIQKALGNKVQLKSGGYLIIDQTEALTTVDVNTGAYVGHRNLEETIFKTNLEAAQAIARQLRLRNLGGIIILDFIDMMEVDHREAVLKALQRALEKDRTKTQVSEVSSLGLVQMTRKRTRESLGQVLCQPCPLCEGRGSVKTTETVSFEIFREILREARQYEARQFLILASQEVVDRMLDEESNSVAELESFIGIPIKFQAEALYTQEQYDVVLM